jgi:hypothetical protein
MRQVKISYPLIQNLPRLIRIDHNLLTYIYMDNFCQCQNIIGQCIELIGAKIEQG